MRGLPRRGRARPRQADGLQGRVRGRAALTAIPPSRCAARPVSGDPKLKINLGSPLISWSKDAKTVGAEEGGRRRLAGCCPRFRCVAQAQGPARHALRSPGLGRPTASSSAR
jgi:hypothetical protein